MKGRIEIEKQIENNLQHLLIGLPDFVKEWYYNLKANDMTASSCYTYLTKIKSMLAYYNKPINQPNELSQLTTIEFFNSIKNSEGKETSIALRQWTWTAMNNLFTYLVNTHALTYNYMNTIKRPRNKNQDVVNLKQAYLTVNDFNKILKAIENNKNARLQKVITRDKLITYLFMITGIRRTALCSIDIQDINLENHTLSVIDKGDKLHVYELNDVIIEMINVWLKDREKLLGDAKIDALFITNRKKRIGSSTIYPMIEKYSKMALGYGISPHKLRAGFCSILYNKTHDIEFVRRVVGHTNVQTTQRYIATNNKERKEASNIMENILHV